MNETPAYREYHPKPYRPRVSTYWWLFQRSYFRFILRELSSVSVAFFVVVTLLQISALSRGPEAHAAMMAKLRSPGWIIFHVVALIFALYHTITWFQATGVVQVVRVGDRQVPPALVVAGNFVAWVVVSLFILYWLLVRS